MQQLDILSIHNIMIRLGIPSNYIGFYYITFAIYLSIQDISRLEFITKLLYPDIAKFFNTNWGCIEHNIRTIIKVIWNKNPDCFEKIADKHFISRPTSSEFVSYLTYYCIHSLQTDDILSENKK